MPWRWPRTTTRAPGQPRSWSKAPKRGWCAAGKRSRSCLPRNAFRAENQRFMTHSGRRRLAVVGFGLAVLAAAGLGTYFVADGRPKEAGKGAGKGRAAVLVTAALVQPRPLEIYEDVVGSIENVIDPTVGAEVAGRVTRVNGFTGKKVAKGELLA